MAKRIPRGHRAGHNDFSPFISNLESDPSHKSHYQTIADTLPTKRSEQMKTPSLEEKVAFFDQLDALDHMSDGDDEVDGREQDHRDKSRAFFGSRKKPESVQGSASIHPRRTTSMPSPSASASANTRSSGVIEATPGPQNTTVSRAGRLNRLLADTTSFIEETPIPDTARPLPATLRRSATLPVPASSSAVEHSPSAGTAARKRKRQSLTKTVPESAQIFRGLSFYYIPNNDIAPARKLRIGKAQEYGARWVRSLGDASHVIVDKHLEYRDIEGILGSDTAARLTVVNEEYPIDCLSFRTLLNPDQNRYRVAGCPAGTSKPASDETSPVASQTSDRSLQVKLPQTSKRQGSEGTPPRSEPSQGSVGQPDAISGRPPAAQVPPAAPSEQPIEAPDQMPPPPRRRSSTKDELSEYIELLQQYKDLPLDPEDDDLQSVRDTQGAVSDSEIEEGSEDERARKRTARARGKGQKAIPFEERFACNRGGTKDKSADAANPNAKIIEVLQSMCDYYSRINDHWRTTAYRKAITTLRRQPVKITTEEDAYRLPNIGRRLAAKIEEIASTNRLRRLEYANDEPLDQVLETFLKIYDVGLSRANKWIAQGFRTLDDLRNKADLTTNQRIGLDHYDDLNTRIPRDEITALFAFVQREAVQLDPDVELLVGGSYRRGADSSGDMDIIVTKKGTTSSADLVPFLEELVAVLFRKGFLVATLAALHAHRPGKEGPGSKWHGCCVLPESQASPLPPHQGQSHPKTNLPPPPPPPPPPSTQGQEPKKRPWRRLDLLLVPESEYGAALIYFTGNDIFNRSMRLLASKKGMRLNQRGLYKEVLRGRNRAKVTEGELLEGRDERRIFELLGVKWREPGERWC